MFPILILFALSANKTKCILSYKIYFNIFYVKKFYINNPKKIYMYKVCQSQIFLRLVLIY